MKKKLSWHFVGDRLRDGCHVPKDGEWLEYDGPLVMCESGLHWSREPFDALQYAPGNTLCLVEVGGKVIEEDDKGVSSRRKIIARMDATELLRYFARMQALSVIHLWDAPDVVLDYLMTGDESIKDAAVAAAMAAAWTATRDAWAAAGAVAGAVNVVVAAAVAAAWDAAWAASWASRDAARDAARKDFNALVAECFEAWL